MSRAIVISRRTRRVEAQGQVRWQMPDLVVEVDRAELAKYVAKALERRLRDVVKWAPSRWQGFAHWLEGRIVATDDSVEYPDSDAFQRFAEDGAQFGFTRDTIEDTIDKAVAEYLEGAVR